MPEVTVERTDSQKSQNNSGPRVSFNRDVHVKRIGSRPFESEKYQQYHPQLRRELLHDLTKEDIVKEAALVLAQAERVKCRVDSNQNPKKKDDTTKFHSLPTRKKKATKPISRSVSDASTKKAKKPSIFNLFSRKSDTNLDQIDEHQRRGGVTPVTTSSSSPSKRLVRSKSDVGGASKVTAQQQRKRNNSENEETGASKKKAQLSPIIENPPHEDFFADETDSIFQADDVIRHTDATAKIADVREKIKNNSVSSKKVTTTTPLSTSAKLEATNLAADVITTQSGHQKQQQQQQPTTTTATKSATTVPSSGNIGYTHQNDLDLIPSKPTAATLTATVRNTISALAQHSKSVEDMHSSQQPTMRPALTKGLTVDGMVKRLSMERFSPPPQLASPAFSYTRPNDQIIYAQVVCDADGRHKQTVHSTFVTSKDTTTAAAASEMISSRADQVDHGEVLLTSPQVNNNNNHKNINNNNSSSINNNSRSAVPHRRHYSDEDEGFDDFRDKRFTPIKPVDLIVGSATGRLVEEPPIVPIIRDLSPVQIPLDIGYRGRADGIERMTGTGAVTPRNEPMHNEFNQLSHRRAILESRINSRRIGSREVLDKFSPERDVEGYHQQQHHQRHRSPAGNEKQRQPPQLRRSEERFIGNGGGRTDEYHNGGSKYHRFASQEILNKYSPERSHLDIISPTKSSAITSSSSSRRVINNGVGGKYNNENGFVETYRSETTIGPDGVRHHRESKSRDRIGSPTNRRLKEIDLGYIEDHHPRYERELSPSYYQDKYRTEYEPRSLESDFNRMSPVHVEHHNQHHQQSSTLTRNKRLVSPDRHEKERMQTIWAREKNQQRSFDKGDSGIENDFRKDSFNGADFQSRSLRRSYLDNVKLVDLFLNKERRHTEDTHPTRHKSRYVFRERSIDDGSHFDPRLDKYIDGDNSIRRREKYSNGHKSVDRSDTIKSEKKLGGLEKMKLLLTGSNKKKQTTTGKTGSDGTNSYKSAADKSVPNNNAAAAAAAANAKMNMVREEEMRSRYREHRGPAKVNASSSSVGGRGGGGGGRSTSSGEQQHQFLDVTTVDREHETSDYNNAMHMTDAAKASDIALRRRLSTPKASPIPKRTNASTQPPSSESSGQKSGWFKSLDRLSRKKQQAPKKPPPQPEPLIQKERTVLSKTLPRHNSSASKGKNLRFFGDTDVEGNGSVSRAHPFNKKPQQPSTLSRHSKYSQSVSNLNRMDNHTTDHRSGSLQHLNNVREHRTASRRDLRDISESASDVEEEAIREAEFIVKSVKGNDSAKHKYNRGGSYARDDNIENMQPDRNTLTRDRKNKKPPPGPQKPARAFERRRAFSKEREHLHDNSSGTEGDSSQQSQRSVVYLHATTVGAIPQPYVLNRARAASREELSSRSRSSMQAHNPQPMTRTVSRSVSMLAPWKPKHGYEGVEINYSQTNDKPKTNTMSRNSTLSRKSREPTDTLTRTRRSTDELSSGRPNSSIGSQRTTSTSYPNGTLTRSKGGSRDHHRRVSPHRNARR